MKLSEKHTYIPHEFERMDGRIMQRRAEEFYKQMDRRRTIREFSPDPIPDGIIENAILAASTAPSGAHKQPWFFCVVKDGEMKRKIRIAAEKEEKQNYEQRFPKDWLTDLEVFGTDEHKEYLEIAPALIVCFRQNYQLIDGKRVKNYYVQESAGIAAGMLITALHNAGLCTLTHTPNPMAFLSQILERPKNEVPFLLLPVGYPPAEGTVIPELHRKSLDQIMKVF